MNPNSAINDSNDHTLHVDTHPVTLRLRPGSTVFAVRGEAWITQEGLHDDIIVAPGQRFVVRRRGSLVINATRGAADLFIVPPELARAHPAADVFDFARSRATALRRAETVRIAAHVAAALRSFVVQLRSAATLRPRATSL